MFIPIAICLCGLTAGCQNRLAREINNDVEVSPIAQDNQSSSKTKAGINTTVAADLKKANQLAEDNMLEQALRQIESVLRKYPDHVTALMTHSRILMRMNRSHDAQRSLLHVIQLEPGNMDAKLILGYCYLDQNKWEEAEINFAEVAYSEGTVRQRISAYLGLAFVFEHRGQKELVSICYQEAIDLDEGVAEILMQAERQFFWPNPVSGEDERSSRPSPSMREIERVINDVKSNPK